MNQDAKSARFVLSIALAGCSVGLAGCGADIDSGGDSTVADVGQQLYGNPNDGLTYWNNGKGTPATIPVCWSYNAVRNQDTKGRKVSEYKPGFPGIAALREWTRTAVENSWAHAANIVFTGWNDTCNHKTGQGDDDDRFLNGNKVMFGFATSGDSCDILGKNPGMATMIRISTDTSWEPDYRTVAIHEMGHALGFAHEQDRLDNYATDRKTPLYCVTAQGPDDGGTTLNADVWGTTRVDKYSTMCYDTELDLSPDDIMGVQALYGRKPSGSLIGAFGECARLTGSSNGSGIVSASCQGAGGTTWYSDRTLSARDLLRSRSSNSLCWGVSLPGSSSSTIRGYTCKDDDSLAFPLQRMRWRAIGDMCVNAVSAVAGSQLQIGKCGDWANQRWDFFQPIAYTGGEQVGQIRLNGTNLCVTAPNAPPNIGDALTLQTCIWSGDFSRQTFTLVKGTHTIYHAGLHFNVFGGWPDTGAIVGLWNMPEAQNSKFHMSGSLTSSGKCAYFKGARGSGLTAGTCQAPPSPDARGLPRRDPQEWYYYW